MISRLDLLEKRLSLKESPVLGKRNEDISEETQSVFTALDRVHELANELWRDSQIFGPHQSIQGSPPISQLPKTPTPGFTKRLQLESSSSLKRAVGEMMKRSAEELITDLSQDECSKLDQLALSYSKAMDYNNCLNILAEVELWLQLLVEDYDSSLSSFAPKDRIFFTVASRIYFVSKVIELQMYSTLLYVDSEVWHFVCKNYTQRIPSLVRIQLEKLISVQEQRALKVDELFHLSEPKKCALPKDNRVAFQQETDGRSNFLNQNDFHAFCKQRDLFYVIKDIWLSRNSISCNNEFSRPVGGSGSYPSHSSSNFQGSYFHTKKITPKVGNQQLSSDLAVVKMKQLMQLNSNPTNVSRLAALFLSQFLLDAANSKDIGFEVADENLRQIFESNPSKFKQLENRFPKPKGQSSDPLAFLKYFIDLASWPDFNQHFIDRCVLEIREMDGSIEREEIRNPKEIIRGLNKTRLLAQILGHVYFHPYRHPVSFGKAYSSLEFETQMQNQIQLRFYQRPPLDLTEIIYKSIASKKLSFTLPWVIEFLCQADSTTYHLHSYSKTLTLIVQLYGSILSVSYDGPPVLRTLCDSNRAFLRFYCSHLFQKQDFPFNMVHMDLNVRDERLTALLSKTKDGSAFDYEDLDLDSQSVLGDALISMLFDRHMSDMRSILCTGRKKPSETSAVNILTPKNIRPVTLRVSSLPNSSRKDLLSKAENEANQFQKQLQSSFFQSNPPSVKRSIDFISERISSNFVRHLRTNLFPTFKDDCISKDIWGEDAVIPLHNKALKVFREIYLPKSNKLVELLLGDTLSVSALQACKSVAAQRSATIVYDWVKSHVNKNLFPLVTSPSNSPMRASLNSSFLSSPTKHFAAPTSVTSKFQPLIKLQRLLQKIYNIDLQTKDITEELTPVLKLSSLGNSQLAVCTTLDIALALLTFFPLKFSSEVENDFVSYWISTWKHPIKILCSRNILLFEQSGNSELTWKRVASLVCRLIQVNVIHLKEIEEQCIAFLRHDWPPPVLLKISELSRRVSGSSSAKSEESEVIDWISWACSEGLDLN